MSGRRDVALGKPELELKVATRALIAAAGGTDGAGATCGARQQRMSDCQNRHTADFLRIDEIGALEDVTAGAGWPHVTSALARRQGFVLVPIAEGACDPDGLLLSLGDITAEVGDVAQALTSAVRPCSEAGRDCSAAEAGVALDQVDDLLRVTARLRAKLLAIRDGRG